MEKTIALMTKWREHYGEQTRAIVDGKWQIVKTDVCASFIVIWSDHTWDQFDIMRNENADWTNYHDIKKMMGLQKIVSKKMTKEQAIEYINEKIKEWESLT